MTRMMQAEDYPPQEPLGQIGAAFGAELGRRATGLPPWEEFGYGNDPYQRILAWRPPDRFSPTLAFLHGGGWTNGTKEWMAGMAPGLVGAGFGFASIGYRLAPAAVFPAQLEDVAVGSMALQDWASSDGAPSPLFLGGHSAGGHLAALLALRPELGGATITGCLPISGVYRFGPGAGMSSRPRFLGPETPDGAAEAAASPAGFVHAGAPPFLLAHGDADFPHLIVQAEAFEAALRAAGVAVNRLVLPGRDHFSAGLAATEPTGPWFPAATAFMRRWAERV